MLTVTFAFVVATALFLYFKQTRWMGVVGVFILLCLNPLAFGAVLLLAVLVFYLAYRRPKYEVIPRGRLPGDAGTHRRNDLLALAALGIGGALVLGQSEPTSENPVTRVVGAVRAAPRNEGIVLRTPSDLLKVFRVEVTEMLDATIQREIFGINVGMTMPRVRVPAVYRFHIPLEPEGRVVRVDGVFTIVAPRIRPRLPVAISRDYTDHQREDARETVREFARKRLVEQTRWKRAGYEDIRVLFADELVGTIAPLSG